MSHGCVTTPRTPPRPQKPLPAPIREANERRPPTRNEAVIVLTRTQARRHRIDEPQLIADPGQLMDVNVTGIVRGARQVAGVITPASKPLGNVGSRPELPNNRSGAN